jgi:predicted TIM-barrel fold metal-dependent hydrolase
MCFPSFPQYCGQLFARSGDRELALALLKAYNDWHIEDWCGAYPGRFIPLALPPIWDPQLMAEEVRRVAAKGCHAISFSENPAKLGLPSFHSDHWDPFWQACSDEGTVVCMHIGSSSTVPITALDAPPDVMITLTPMNIVSCASDLVFSPVLRKFPDLTIALSEGGIGWIPYVLERLDYTYKHHHKWTHQDFGDALPSELFNKHFVTCFIDDAFGLANHNWLNLDMVTWECDYPHSDSTWPVAPETLARTLGGMSGGDVAKVTHTNAMRIFQYDPFSVIPPEQATVAALLAQATDVDVTPRSLGKRHDDDTTTMDDFVNGPDAWAGVAFGARES